MAREPIPDVPLRLIEYLQGAIYPRTGGLIKLPSGEWENPLDAAARRGHQDVLNYLMFLYELQNNPDLSQEERSALMVDVDSEGRVVFGEDSHVLRPAR